MSKTLDRDPKSCLERWKNYLKPGIKKGSLTPEEQALVISLQAKYGNKWKKIAAEVPGRTAKRLGKWWEVFKEKQVKAQQQKVIQSEYAAAPAAIDSPEKMTQGKYDHILETFAEKYVFQSSTSSSSSSSLIPLPSWISVNLNGAVTSNTTSSSSSSSSSISSSTTSFSLSPSEAVQDPVQDPSRFIPVQEIGKVIELCREVEEGKELWRRHKKEAEWRLTRLEQQLEAEKGRRRKEKMEEIEMRVRRVREEAAAYVSRMEGEMREEMQAVEREEERKEEMLMEAWRRSHVRLGRIVERIGGFGGGGGGGGGGHG